MNAILTEDEEGEIVKGFIRRYQKLFLVGLLVVAAIVAGTLYMQKQSLYKATRASEAYQEMLVAEYNKDTNTVNAKGQYLLEQFPKTPYAQMASLLLAKVAVKNGELDKAEQNLRWVLKQSSANTVPINLAKLRLAAILHAQNKNTEALELVSSEVDEAFASLFAEARGDIYIAQQDSVRAKDAYLQAKYSLPQGMQAPLLQMKLADLGVNNA